jgi:hypothetical protein
MPALSLETTPMIASVAGADGTPMAMPATTICIEISRYVVPVLAMEIQANGIAEAQWAVHCCLGG